jgi:F0F1-type ATP synthase membrane subunit c/vacuolar-type H+-ATPase subunit K
MNLARELKVLLRYSFFIVVALFVLVSPTNAQNAAAIATYITIDHPNVIDGYIVATQKEKFVITNEAYQGNMIGIVNKKAAIEIKFGNNPDSYPVSTSGQSYVLVTLANGDIKKGDYITSSPIEGVGMKATVPGPIIGVALEDASNPDESTVTKVKVSIQKDYNVEPLFGISNVGDNPFFNKNTDVIKFFFGGLVLIISLLFSYLYFGKLSLKGVEALGRNPLASSKIQAGIILNVIMAVSVCLIGLITAMYIIRS